MLGGDVPSAFFVHLASRFTPNGEKRLNDAVVVLGWLGGIVVVVLIALLVGRWNRRNPSRRPRSHD